MNIDFYSKDELNLRYADEQTIKSDVKHPLNTYSMLNQNKINFNDVFDIDQSESNQRSRGKFFSNNNIKLQKDSKKQLTVYLQQNLANLKSRRKTIHHPQPLHLLKNIQNVLIPTNNKQLIEIFMKSVYFLNFIRLIILINMVAIFLIDYEFRIKNDGLSMSNIVSLCLQLFCNCVFTVEIALKLYQNAENITNPYLIVNLLGTLSCWITIFFDLIQYDTSIIFRIFMMIRIFRSIIRILQVFQFLRKPFEVFMHTIPSLQKLFFPLIIIMLFYALIGMSLFAQANHYRCTEIVGEEVIIGKFCGAAAFKCPEHQTCQFIKNPPVINTPQNQFNLVNFDNIASALLTVYHFVFNTNFSEIRAKYSFYINPYISFIFFISMTIFFFYIFSNLIMISMSKAYMQKVQNILQKQKTKQETDKDEHVNQSTAVKVIYIINMCIIIMATIITSLTHTNMSTQFIRIQSLMDFILLWISLALMVTLIIMQNKKYFKNYFNMIDLITIVIHFIDFIICGANNQDIIYNSNPASLVLRSFKVLRIIRLLYISQSIFAYQKYVINVFLKTVYKVRYFLLLCMCFVFMFKQIGELFFAYQIRFQELKVSKLSGIPFINNFQNFWSSLFSILYLFFNQQWATTMYYYYQATGLQAIFFFTIIAFIAHLMLMRLYIAVFLSYFKEELHKKSKKDILKQKNMKYEKTLKELIKNNVSAKNLQALNNSQFKKAQHEEEVDANNLSQNQNCLTAMLKYFFKSQKFYYIISTAIAVHCITILFRHADDSQHLIITFQTIQNLCFSLYVLQVILGCIINGIYFPKHSYLKQSKSNIISFITMIMIILSLIPFGNKLVNNYLRRICIIKIFTIFRQTDKEMTIILDTIFQISKKFFNFILIYTFFLLIISIIPLKLFADSDDFFTCNYAHNQQKIQIWNQQECTHMGGLWQHQVQRFTNIFSSVALMYQIVSTEAWSTYLQSLWHQNKRTGWLFYFVAVFFIYNICFLNIFMGFIVQTYLHLKDKAYNLNLLKRSQRGWILIKNSINCLIPKSIITIPAESSFYRTFFFNIVTSQLYTNFFDYLAYFNAILYIISYHKQGNLYQQVLDFLKRGVIFLFLLDTSLKMFALRNSLLKLNNSYLQLSGAIYISFHMITKTLAPLNNQQLRISQSLMLFFMLLRCKSLLTKYSWCKTHLNSVIDILPKCGKIIKLVCCVLFFYASLGMQIFKYVKIDQVMDNYNIGFDDFITSLYTLTRVSVSQSWYLVISAFIKTSSEADICHYITNYDQVLQYGKMGCGTMVAYPYFLSFHIITVLLIINLLIATMASAYDDNYQIQYNSVNIFQLEDCLNLWQKYDPQGTGVVHYKKFWRLTSQIAILFGISKKKLIKRKNKFFEELDLQIYQQNQQSILCYRFHDVITKFSKIKLQITNMNHQNRDLSQGNQIEIQFDINPTVLKEIKDYITPCPDELYANFRPFKQYKSGQTKYIFGLLKKLRQWKHASTEKKRIIGGTKLSSIFDLKSRKMMNQSTPISSDMQLGYFP